MRTGLQADSSYLPLQFQSKWMVSQGTERNKHTSFSIASHVCKFIFGVVRIMSQASIKEIDMCSGIKAHKSHSRV